MTKHNVRCSCCNKFVTWRDLLDDGVCEACAKHLNAYTKRRTKLLMQLLCAAILAAIVFGGMVFFLALTCNKANAENVLREEYFVTGTNELTGERVVGWVDGVLGESEVQGTVLDRGERYVVVGQANGKGSFELRSLCCTYAVVVADEVTSNKRTNRKQWQEVWK